MGTVFKVGMDVYDQLNFPDKEGKVVYICKDELVTSPITVIFKDKYNQEIERYYTSDGRYKIDKLPVLSTKPYQIILQGFEQKAPVPEFYEALGWLENNKNYKTVIRDERTYPSMEIYKAFEALRKLIILRDFYNEGWQPDWDDDTVKHIIETCCNDEFVIEPSSTNYPRVLSFKSKKIRNRFFEEQKELLEIARPLL